MAKRQSTATWQGTLKEGKGVMKVGESAYEGPFSHKSRFEDGKGTNPEELVGAAHSGCYSMFLAALISGEGLTPESITTTATVKLGNEDGPKITEIILDCNVVVSGLEEAKFNELAQTAKQKCPISRLYQGTSIVLNAKLVAHKAA